jgi:hypothetical protein
MFTEETEDDPATSEGPLEIRLREGGGSYQL